MYQHAHSTLLILSHACRTSHKLLMTCHCTCQHTHSILLKVVPWLMLLVADLSSNRLAFDPRPFHVRFMTDKMALGWLDPHAAVSIYKYTLHAALRPADMPRITDCSHTPSGVPMPRLPTYLLYVFIRHLYKQCKCYFYLTELS